ncbi:hypothetical protein [Cognatiyoonia sp. IB215182]|uniref:hypothetical protein n=1 Tax=Cognatiyoonia sp. IB215182 TaxID=3097353 RepID=UPI002A0C3C1E|nr:hypothetical protein [Cognatiyoonia sp. IB215182]MDX8355552.1 hypothetical protein [Cognatiyoonia sp. IB215182]
MKRLFLSTVALMASTFQASGESITIEQMVTAINQMCSGGSESGEFENVTVSGSGDVRLLKIGNIANIGADATLEVTNEEWDGIRPLSDRTQTSQIECVVGLLPFFESRVAKIAIEESDASVQNNTSTGDCNNVGGSGNTSNCNN